MKSGFLGAAVAVVLAAVGPAASPSVPWPVVRPYEIDFRDESPSRDAREIAQWAIRVEDHKTLPFAVVDKVNARVYTFDGDGRFVSAAPVLIGMGVGDTFAPGVMQMDMYKTKPWQRITPAGRFEAEIYEKGRGRSTLWVDYDAGIALHKMPVKKTAQKRAQRIVSPKAADHRITYGCINVPPAFYDEVVYPLFKPQGGIVYVLPDKLPLETVFKSFGVGERIHLRQTHYIER